MNLPYTTALRLDDEGDFIARIQELPGCSAHGKDRVEALANLQIVQRAWIEECLESNQPIPEPEPEEDLPSGKWVQRVPRTLHKKLSELAKREEVSLNQLVTSMLSSAVTARSIRRGNLSGYGSLATKRQRHSAK
jgi:antitoxin HicB